MENNFKLESEVEGQVQPKVEPKPEFKYLEVEVSRQQNSFVILKVPYSFDPKTLRRGPKFLGRACEKTLMDSDWDDYGWQQDIECQGYKEISEKDATAYEVFEVTKLDLEQPKKI